MLVWERDVYLPQQVAKHARRHDICLTEARCNCWFSYSKKPQNRINTHTYTSTPNNCLKSKDWKFQIPCSIAKLLEKKIINIDLSIFSIHFGLQCKGFRERIIQADLKCTWMCGKPLKSIENWATETKKTKRVKPKYHDWNMYFHRLLYCRLVHYEIEVTGQRKWSNDANRPPSLSNIRV